MNNQLTAPTKIPHDIKIVSEKEAPPSSGFGVAGMEGLGGSNSGVIGSVFGSGNAPKVKAEAPKKVNISGGVAAGMLLQKTVPLYPPIAKAARVSGTVVLAGNYFQDGHHRKPACDQRARHVAAVGHGCCEILALPALPAQRRTRRGGNHGQRSLHPWRLNLSTGPFPHIGLGPRFLT